jgi:PhnB protein
MHIAPYLFFNGRCDEAIEFYGRALGAEVLMLVRNGESPEPAPPGQLPPGSENKVRHCNLRIGKTVVMASDGFCSGQPDFKGVSLSIAADTVADAERMFAALANGGTVQLPLASTFWSPRFGMVADRFGLGWMVSVAARQG